MYMLESFANGYALVTGHFYRSNFRVVDQVEASSLVVEMNRPEVLGKLSGYRWKVETGGLISNGIPLHTDRESQTTIVLTAQQGTGEMWKGSDGKFYSLTATEIQACADAVMQHKRDCFAAESQIVEEINTITDHNVLSDYNLYQAFDEALEAIKNPVV